MAQNHTYHVTMKIDRRTKQATRAPYMTCKKKRVMKNYED